MSAVDDLVELVERAGAAERAALASKWKDRDDVEDMIRHVQRRIDEQRDVEQRTGHVAGLTGRWARLREAILAADAGSTGNGTSGDGHGGGARIGQIRPSTDAVQAGVGTDSAHPGDHLSTSAEPDRAVAGTDIAHPPVGYAEATRAERDAEAAVTVAGLALLEAHLAVLKARLARIDAGEAEPGASVVDGHTALVGRNAVSRHGPALAHGLRGEIDYILTRKPRSVVRSLGVSLALGLLYLGFIRAFEWDTKQQMLPYLGLWAISVVMGGAVCLNAMSFDAMRVRAALDSGARLWHVLVIKNLALLTIVAPIGFLLSGLLAWRAGNLGAFFKACALMICFIVLWLGVGNVLSIVLPIRDEPLKNRRSSGSLRQFLVAFTVSYLIGYMVNLMLIWRVFAAQQLTARLGNVVIPAILVILSSLVMWFLLTVFALALSQQPKIRRALMREIADYSSNAEARAYADEAAKAETEAVDERSAMPPAPR